MTSDGRDFSKLAQAEVDALNDQEYDRYQKWKIGNKIAANNQKQEIGTQLDAANNQLSILNSNFEAGKIIEKIHFSDEDKSKINSLLSEAKS